MLALSFPSFDLEMLAWLVFVPLFFAVKDKRPAVAFLLSYLSGIVFFALTVFWLAHVTLPGVIVLILYLALYFGIFGFCVSFFSSLPVISYLLSVSAVWVLLEYLRSYLLTGFGWALLGYSQYLTLPVVQIADITGVWGISFLIMAVNIALFTVLERRKSLSVAYYLLPAVLLLATLGYGFYQLNRPPAADHQPRIKISVIQGNIPQELKWQSNAQGLILDRYLGLSRDAGQDKPDLLVWPEASSPGFLGEDDWVFDDIFSMVKHLRTNLLVGTVAA
ncbi:MAG: apolipoprotein N-acyltransferase, partial [Candidatus Omnitrophota bacterium]